ncbi:MAG TPA: hypothetical protein DCL77_13005 [Prolixibacteraceae bacterium]|jgi:hypothetical protein|nr:hypothetical protein [Prolixibacteraceae bacterium]
MKKLLIVCIILLGFSQLKAQDVITPKPDGYHRHDGFYLSLCGGPVFGSVMDHINSYGSASTLNMSGTGGVFDLKIGGAIKENLILHAAIISNAVTGPTLETTSNMHITTVKAPDTFGVGEAMWGVGVTYYVMPSNILVSGTLGLGKFSLTDTKDSNNNITTEGGLSVQLKLGKEWWVSKNWGLGVGLTYGATKVTNESTGNPTEELGSNRFGILFNTTFN